MTIADDALTALQNGAAGAAKGAAIGSIVPGVGTAIGGLAGGLLGVATSVLPSEWLGAGETAVKAAAAVQAVTGTSDPAQAAAAIAADPSIEAGLRVQLVQLANDARAEENRATEARLQAGLKDVADARARDIALRQTGGRNPRADIMLGVTIIGIAALLALAILSRLDGNSAIFGLVSGIVGLLSKCYADAFQFEFGSSRGSADKSDTIASLAQSTVPMQLLPKPAVIEPAK